MEINTITKYVGSRNNILLNHKDSLKPWEDIKAMILKRILDGPTPTLQEESEYIITNPDGSHRSEYVTAYDNDGVWGFNWYGEV